MAASERLSLLLESRTTGEQDIARLEAAINRVLAAADKTSSQSGGNKIGQQFSEAGKSAADSAVQFTAATTALVGWAAAIKAATKDAAEYAARTQTLSVAVDNLARTNNLNRDAVRAVTLDIQKQGITAQQAYSVVSKMIQANLDLSQASKLARAAQDSAVIAGVNSGQALNGIIHGITTRQTDVLRTYGIAVTFEDKFAQTARKLGRELTENEKQVIAFQTVMDKASSIAGTYEAAMGTVGKQMTSLQRHFDDTKDAIGTGFLPALSQAVHVMEQLAKYAQENAEGFTSFAAGITATTAAMAVFRFTPGPVWLKGIAAGATFVGTSAFLDQDPVAFARQTADTSMGALDRRRKDLVDQFNGTRDLTTLRALRSQIDAIDDQKRLTETQYRESLAQIYGQRIKSAGSTSDLEKGLGLLNPVSGLFAPTLGSDLVRRRQQENAERAFGVVPDSTFGFGITRQAILDEIAKQKSGLAKPTGPLLNEDLIRQQEQQQKISAAAESAKRQNEAFQSWVSSQQKNVLDSFTLLQFEWSEAIKKFGPQNKSGVDSIMRERVVKELDEFQQKQQKFENELQSALAKGIIDRSERAMKLFIEGAKRQMDEYVKGEMERRDIAAIPLQGQLRGISSTTNFQSQLERLTLPPSAQGLVIQRNFQREEQAAWQRYSIEKQLADLQFDEHQKEMAHLRAVQDLEFSLADARYQKELSIAELRKKQADDFAENVMRGFDALTASGSGGLRTFFQSTIQGIERQIVGNFARSNFSMFSGKLQLPGQGTAENPNFLGKLLQGTPFGLDSKDLLKTSTDANTAATIANTQALLTRAGFGAGAAGSILSGIPDLVFGGSTGNPFVFSATRDSKLLEQVAAGRGLTGIDLGTGIPGVNLNPGSKYASLYKGLGIAGAIAGGGYGIYRGVQEGGVQGALTATSSAAGMGAALLPLLGVAGPLAPILGFASLGFMGLKSLFGDPREKRDRFISKTLDSSRYDAPSSINYEVDEYGGGIDYNKRGQLRPMIIINQNIDNIDAKSLIDRGPDIAEATRQAVERGHAAALTEMIQQQGKPY